MKLLIDIVVNGNVTPQGIEFEPNALDSTYGSPARAIQVSGALLSQTNPLPIARAATSFYANYGTATRAGASVLKTGASRLLALDSDGTALDSAIYIQFFDRTTLPSASTRCRRYFPVLPGSWLVLDDLAMDFTTGLVVAASTTRDTYTAIDNSDLNTIYFTSTYR
jgi:hypothetical protein